MKTSCLVQRITVSLESICQGFFFFEESSSNGKNKIKRLVRKPEGKVDAEDREESFPIQQQSDRLILVVLIMLFELPQ